MDALFLQVEASSLDAFLFAGQDHGEQLLCRGSVATSFTIATELQEVSADDVLDILVRYGLVLGVIDELAKGLIHGLVCVTTHEHIDALKAISGAVVDIVLGLVLDSDDIVDLFTFSMPTITDTNIYEGSFASVPVLNAQSQGDVIQGEVIRIFACTIEFVVAVYDAEDFVLVLPQMPDPPLLLVGGWHGLGVDIGLALPGRILHLVSGENHIGIRLLQQLLKKLPPLLIKLRRSCVDVCRKQDLNRILFLREVDEDRHS